MRAKKQSTGKPVRRGSYRVFIGDGAERWSLADPGHPIAECAEYTIRYGKPFGEADPAAMTLTSFVSDMRYLLYVCPSTKLACAKLAEMRAAVRKLGPVDDE